MSWSRMWEPRSGVGRVALLASAIALAVANACSIVSDSAGTAPLRKFGGASPPPLVLGALEGSGASAVVAAAGVAVAESWLLLSDARLSLHADAQSLGAALADGQVHIVPFVWGGDYPEGAVSGEGVDRLALPEAATFGPGWRASPAWAALHEGLVALEWPTGVEGGAAALEAAFAGDAAPRAVALSGSDACDGLSDAGLSFFDCRYAPDADGLSSAIGQADTDGAHYIFLVDEAEAEQAALVAALSGDGVSPPAIHVCGVPAAEQGVALVSPTARVIFPQDVIHYVTAGLAPNATTLAGPAAAVDTSDPLSVEEHGCAVAAGVPKGVPLVLSDVSWVASEEGFQATLMGSGFTQPLSELGVATVGQLQCEHLEFLDSSTLSCALVEEPETDDVAAVLRLGFSQLELGGEPNEICARGREPDGRGRCRACPVNTYKDSAGNHRCTACPTPSGAAGDSELHTSTNGREGSTSAEECLCPVSFVHDPAGTPEGRWPCLPCPAGGICQSVGLQLKDVGNQPGYWRGHPNSTFTSCRSTAACPESGPTRLLTDEEYAQAALLGEGFRYTTPCPVGSLPPLCAVCARGNGTSLSNECGACGTPTEARLGVASVALLVLTLATILAWQGFIRARKSSVASHRRSNNVRVLIDVVQFTSFVQGFNVDWTAPLRSLFQIESTVTTTASLISYDCVDGDSDIAPAVMEFAGYMMWQVASVLAVVLANFVFRIVGHFYVKEIRTVWLGGIMSRHRWPKHCKRCCAGRRRERRRGNASVESVQGTRGSCFDIFSAKDMTFSLFYTVTTLLYPRIVWITFTVLDCTEVEGMSRLRYDLSVSCDGTGYEALRLMAHLSCIFCVLGWPVFVAFLLYSNHTGLYLHGSAATAAKSHVPVLLEDVQQLRSGFEHLNARERWEELADYRIGHRTMFRVGSLANILISKRSKGKIALSSRHAYRLEVPPTPIRSRGSHDFVSDKEKIDAERSRRISPKDSKPSITKQLPETPPAVEHQGSRLSQASQMSRTSSASTRASEGTAPSRIRRLLAVERSAEGRRKVKRIEAQEMVQRIRARFDILLAKMNEDAEEELEDVPMEASLEALAPARLGATLRLGVSTKRMAVQRQQTNLHVLKLLKAEGVMKMGDPSLFQGATVPRAATPTPDLGGHHRDGPGEMAPLKESRSSNAPQSATTSELSSLAGYPGDLANSSALRVQRNTARRVFKTMRRRRILLEAAYEDLSSSIFLGIEQTVFEKLSGQLCNRNTSGQVTERYKPTLNEAFALILAKLEAVAIHQRSFGFAFILYRPNAWLMEIVMLLRKIAMIAASVFVVTQGRYLQIASGLVIVLISMLITWFVEPYAVTSLYKRNPKYVSKPVRVLRKGVQRYISKRRFAKPEMPLLYLQKRRTRWAMPDEEVRRENWRRDIGWTGELRNHINPLIAAARTRDERESLLRRRRILEAKRDGRPPEYQPLISPALPLIALVPELFTTESLEMIALLVMLANLTGALLLGVTDPLGAPLLSPTSGTLEQDETMRDIVTAVLLTVNLAAVLLFVLVLVCDLAAQFTHLESAGADKQMAVAGFVAEAKRAAKSIGKLVSWRPGDQSTKLKRKSPKVSQVSPVTEDSSQRTAPPVQAFAVKKSPLAGKRPAGAGGVDQDAKAATPSIGGGETDAKAVESMPRSPASAHSSAHSSGHSAATGERRASLMSRRGVQLASLATGSDRSVVSFVSRDAPGSTATQASTWGQAPTLTK